MEGEVNNAILVWSTVVACLCYCHTAGKAFPYGIRRRLAVAPIICLFFFLPLRLTSMHFGAVTCFFVAWLANFKLMLFAFNKGPLYSDPPYPLSRFIFLACFPIKPINQNPNGATPHETSHKSLLNYATKLALVAALIRLYDYKQHMHPKIVLFFYSLHMYFMLEMLLALFGGLAKALIRIELEPQFDEPYLSTSLQDFWGRRWNLMVPKVLHPTVYEPIRSILACFVGRKWAIIPAVGACFLVSGLMHELVVYNFARLRPTGEMMCFFVLHGVSLTAEIIVKKMVSGKFRLPGVVSGPLTLGYVIYTSFLLFFPPFLRGEAEVKGCTESLVFAEFVKTGRLVSPTELSCPFL